MSLVELWVLASRLEMASLQNAAIDAIHQIFQIGGEEVTIAKTFEYIYSHTDSRYAKLRRYVVDLCVHYAEEAFGTLEEDHLPRQMLIEITDASISVLKAGRGRKEIMISDYHVDVNPV